MDPVSFFDGHQFVMTAVVPDHLLDPRQSRSVSPSIHSLINPDADSRPSSSSHSNRPQISPPSLLPSPDPNASLQSLLASHSSDSPNGQIHPWAATHSVQSENGAQEPSENTGGKRKLEDSESDDPQNKIRRIVRDHVSHTRGQSIPMTTVICLHAAVAQKSYGSEKRFLCPPPVVHIEGPSWQMRSQQLSMSVVSETGERSFEQRAPLDNNLTASFKFLHVAGTAKAKSFLLTLDIAEPPPASATDSEAGRTWASFESAPVTIISKPSKKTAKTRNISSCILAGGPVSLFNRINSQTVRTKYMTIDNTQLCASNVAWSAFNVNVLRRPTEPTQVGGPQPVTYGSEIVLSDTHSGISTSPLIIRKVDKGRVSPEEGGPVSQMQKIALQRVNPDGSRHYLSAAGPMSGTPGVVSPAPTTGNNSQSGIHPLLFQSPRVREELKDGARVLTDEVDDYLCWTIVGISKFQYTFFDISRKNLEVIPEMPITPFPTLFTPPVHRAANNTLELTVSNFFYEDPKTRAQVPLDVYLGTLGPLRHRVYQASPPGPLTNINPYMPTMSLPDGTTSESSPVSPIGAISARYSPPGPIHTIVIVELPSLAEIVKVVEEMVMLDAEQEGGDPENRQPPSLAGQGLPLLFIRACDGVGYHSGRSLACENVFSSMELPVTTGGNIDTGWLAAAGHPLEPNPALTWILRVI